MNVPPDLLYTEEHEWARVEGDRARVGITDHAQSELGDIVYVELPEVGARVAKGQAFGVVESVKSVSDLYAPVSGEVVAVNGALGEAPETVNRDPYGDGWMIEIRMTDPKETESLLRAPEYRRLVE
ncbi:MAG: glycine cleavage system protein GcvH [Clostridia bacterium]|nr:glycine cleavage system protein GcvH [Clostridia bacterium]